MGLGKSLKGLVSGVKESVGFGGHDKIGNTVGSWMNNFTGSTDMYNREYAGNVALWNMQNEYNTPAAQIARMQAAGIDVNPMTYAVGNGSMSSTAGSISAPSVGASGVNPVSALMSVMSGIQGIRAQQLQNALTEKDLEFYEQNGYRPGTSDWMTILPSLLRKYGPKLMELWKNKGKNSDLNLPDYEDKDGYYSPYFTGGDGKLYPNDYNHRLADKIFSFFGK